MNSFKPLILGKFVVSNTTNYQVIRGVDNGEITETVSR
jgi:hypothetical protein